MASIQIYGIVSRGLTGTDLSIGPNTDRPHIKFCVKMLEEFREIRWF